MKPEPKRRLVRASAALAAIAVLAALTARPIARWFESPPTLLSVARDVHERRFDAAEAGLKTFLGASPAHREANLLMAEVLLDRPNPRPLDALTHLDRLRSRDPKSRAVVQTLKGKALYGLSKFAAAEAAWKDALAADPNTAEAGWLLLQQYYVQDRLDEARALALKLSPGESDPIDRVRYLLELTREDVVKLASAGVIQWLEPAVKADPSDRASTLALGRARAREGQPEGLALLRAASAARPDSFDGWDALLGALVDSGEFDALARDLASVPASLASDPRLSIYRGLVAQGRREYPAAISAFKEALALRPDEPKLAHRLARALRLAGRDDEAKAVEQYENDLHAAHKELIALYKKTSEDRAVGLKPDPVLYQAFADLRERLGRPDEALAWHNLVLRDDPANLKSRLAAARLAAATGGRKTPGPPPPAAAASSRTGRPAVC